MKTFYSKSTNGFYIDDIHGDNIPIDAVEITSEHHKELIEKQSKGSIITADSNGNPILVEPTKAPITPDYITKRITAYPPITDYLDGIVKGDKAQIDKYIADCLAVKAKYPKS